MKKKTLYKQCILKSGKSTMICWLDAKVKKGWEVTLTDSEDPKQWWLITNVADIALAKEDIKDSHDSKNWYKTNYTTRLKGLSVKK